MEKAAIRVLLVDDDKDEFVIVGDLLRTPSTERFDLTWVPTYEQGLAAIVKGCCDVCLVDYRLGQRSGLDLLAEATTIRGHPQVILLTGEGDRGVDVTAARAGAADYLVKVDLTAALLERSIRYAVERGRTMQAMRDARELESLNLAKTAFLTGMSHEMHTPMNAILGMADLLLESPLNIEQTEYVEVLRRAGSDLLVLITDILDLSKMKAGHLELERVKFDLEEVLDRVIESTAVKARSKDLALLSHLAPGLATSLIGDPTRLAQVLASLLGNAVKFTGSGEILLAVRNDESGKSGLLEFTVDDTGIGIPADKLERIFDDFTQLDASLTRQYGGTGLGLGISRRLVKAMGGVLTAISSVGLGSTFRFTVPFDLVPENTDITRVAAEQPAQRVLLIDDNLTSGFILAETLQAWGLESDTFRVPADALTHLGEELTAGRPYSLAVVATSGVPRIDGFETAAKISQIAPGLSIVLLVSKGQPWDAARCLQAGVSGYAVKPVGRVHLLRLVCDAMERHASPEVHAAGGMEGTKKESASPARILVVDDSPDNRLLVQAYLKSAPYQLTFEEDGKAAVERFVTADFDLILMDIRMPVMDGLTATRAIRALERERGSASTQILALTANGSLQATEASNHAGCNAHLTKPISKIELLNAIEKHLRLKPAAMEKSASLILIPV